MVAEPRREQVRCTHSRLGTCPQALGAAPPTGLARVTSESGPWWGSASSKGTCHSAVIAGVSLSQNFMMTANGIP